MMRKLFLLGSMLLFPCLAYGADPAADLPIQVVPAQTANSTQCPSVAPAEAQSAGFTTMVLCQDFTQPIPNTAGTGVTANWNGCGVGPMGIPGWYRIDGTRCADMFQTTDPTTGGLVMKFQYLLSEYGSLPGTKIWIQTDDQGSKTPGQGNYFNFPQASLMEITYRDNMDDIHSGCNGTDSTAFWNWTHEGGANADGVNEFDVIENWRSGTTCQYQVTDSAIHNWNGDSTSNPQIADSVWNYKDKGDFSHWGPVDPNTGHGPTDVFHTYGLLTTTDGINIESCGYIDHILVNCIQMPGLSRECTYSFSSQSGCFGQRNILLFWVGSNGGSPIAGDNIAWVQSWRVWSCPTWNAGSSTITNSSNKCFAQAPPNGPNQLGNTWTGAGATQTSTMAPDGVTPAIKITQDSSPTGNHGIAQSQSFANAISTFETNIAAGTGQGTSNASIDVCTAACADFVGVGINPTTGAVSAPWTGSSSSHVLAVGSSPIPGSCPSHPNCGFKFWITFQLPGAPAQAEINVGANGAGDGSSTISTWSSSLKTGITP